MSRKRNFVLFSDDGPGLDRFGLVLALSVSAVAALSLVDLDDVSSGVRAEAGWLVVTVIVAATLIASLRASGVARRPRRIVEILLAIGVLGVIVLVVVGRISGVSDFPGPQSSDPSFLWVATAVISPIVVLRRVMKQRTVTTATLSGAVAVYLLFALAFNYAFLGVENLGGTTPFFGSPETTSSFMYFSLSTITTVGYGDLAAAGDVGRFLASAEAVIGQVLLVTVVARLVSLYGRTPIPAQPSEGQSGIVTVE